MKRFEWVAVAVTALSVNLAACGGDDGGGGTEEVTDQGTIDQGKATGTTSLELKNVTGNDDTSKSKIHQVGGALQTLQGKYQQAKALAAAGSAGVPTGSVPGGLEAAFQGQEVPAGDANQTGSVEFKDGHLTANFVFSYNAGTSSVDYTYIADLMITGETDTTIDGTFDLDFSIVTDLGAAGAAYGISGAFNTDYELSATYGQVVIGACPDGTVAGKGGELTLDFKVSLSGEGLSDQLKDAYEASGQAGSGTIVVTFNADCTVTVEGT